MQSGLASFHPSYHPPFYFSDMLELCLLMLTSQKGNQQRSVSRINRESRDLPTLSFFYKVHLSCCLLWCIHTSQKRGRGRDQMGWMKLCGCFHITPELIQELGRDLLFNIVLVPITVSASIPVLLSVNTSFIFNIPINTLWNWGQFQIYLTFLNGTRWYISNGLSLIGNHNLVTSITIINQLK